MHLGQLHSATKSRIEALRSLYASIGLLSPQQQSIYLAFITVELDNLIIGSLRAFTISTIRRAKTVGGNRITVSKSLGDEEEIAAYILSVLNSVRFKKLKNPTRISQYDEPKIRDPKETEKVLLDCGASNLPSLQNALSLNSRVFRDVKFVRHFYAHRGKDTFVKVSANAAGMGILNIRHPDEVLRHVTSGRPFSVLEEWLIDTELFFSLLME